jgi:hypothetical protein
MRNLRDLSETEITQALLEVDGDVGLTAINLGLLRGELWNYIRQRRELLDIVERRPKLIVEEAELVLTEALQHKKSWAIILTLRTLGKRRGWGRFTPQSVTLLPRKPDDPGDMARLSPEQRRQFDYFENKTLGYPDGVRPPDPDWVQKLDAQVDFVRSAFANNFYNSRLAAAQIGVTHEQLQEYLALRIDLYLAIGNPCEVLVDMAERGLRDAIAEKKKWAVKFVLTTQGRGRGYSENPYDELPRRQPTASHAVDMARLTPDELSDYEDLLYVVLAQEPPAHKAWIKRAREREAQAAAKKAEALALQKANGQGTRIDQK